MRINKRLLFILIVSVVVIISATAVYATSTFPSGKTSSSTTPIASVSTPQPTGANLTMTAIDVGQGDALLLTFPHNASMLIDGGKENQGATVVAYLRSVGITHLDGVVATHPDADHMGGLLAVLKSVPVDRVYDLGLPKSSDVYAEFLQLIAQKNISYSKSRAGDSIGIDPDTNVSVINPLPSITPTDAPDNDHSIVIKVSYQRISYLLTGDAESPAEAKMISLYNCSAYVLKVAHHGSSGASSAAFLKAVKPRIAVISVGANNSYGHPAPQTLARLGAANATVYRTDKQGTIVVTTNGQTVDVQTARNA